MATIPWLDARDFRFPPLEQALEDPNGLIAVGGDLSPERLIAAYRQGIFPWYEEPQPILWWSPDPRAIIRPDRVHISRSLRKRLRDNNYRISADTAFIEVLQGCAEITGKRPGTWITDSMAQAYCELHQRGVAHSIEVWQNQDLVGGLYGVALGRVFYGESMFSRVSDASKLALVALCRQLQQWGYGMIDCQVSNPHLLSMGAELLPRRQFAVELARLVDQPASVSSDGWNQSQWQQAAR